MVVLILFAQLALRDSTYSSPALRDLVSDAALRNRLVPAQLAAYEARVESEIAFVLRRPEGIEGTAQIEQTASDVRWDRSGAYEQRVVGYRAVSSSISPSALGYMRQAWTVPVLYGNRLSLFFGRDTTRRRPRREERRETVAVHPLAEDRERVYRYSGGDTVVTITLADNRRIRIVRVFVEPKPAISKPTVIFRGEMDLDATYRHIVRLRGHFMELGSSRSAARQAMGTMARAIAYVELVNAEVEGQFWLPSYQRIEAQVMFRAAGDTRSVMRVISRFGDYRIQSGRDSSGTLLAQGPAGPDSAVANAAVSPASAGGVASPTASESVAGVLPSDTMVAKHHRLLVAPRDSLERFAEWRLPIGRVTGEVQAEDFDDIAPDVWRPTGPPRAEFGVPKFSELVRYNRIEGAYTGAGVRMRLRDAAPGVTLAAYGGWAWSEQTARGGVLAERARAASRWRSSARVERVLDNTNDLRAPFDDLATIPALFFTVDDFDYVDRRAATLGLARAFGRARNVVLRLESGVAQDRGATLHASRGLFKGDSGFRANRLVANGDYARNALVLEVNPDVAAELVLPGFGATLSYERGDGDLEWQRAEARLLARRVHGPVTLAARFDAGAVFGSEIPPQRIFEVGSEQGLPGYEYKEFAGDRAVVARGLVMYGLPLLRAPIRVRPSFYLPPIMPALAFGVQSGWTDATRDGLRSIARLGGRPHPCSLDPLCDPAGPLPHIPLSVPTGRIRTSVSMGLRFFGGALGLELARAIDQKDAWGWRVGITGL